MNLCILEHQYLLLRVYLKVRPSCKIPLATPIQVSLSEGGKLHWTNACKGVRRMREATQSIAVVGNKPVI